MRELTESDKARLVEDPVFFASTFFTDRSGGPWVAHSGQAAIMRDQHPVVVVACGRRWGKSEAVSISFDHYALTRPNTTQFVLSHSQDQANIVFRYAYNFVRKSELSEQIASIKWTPHPQLTFVNGSVIEAYSLGEEGNFLLGKSAHRIWIDEASRVDDEAVKRVIRPMLWDFAGQLGLISTPFGHNYFYEEWMKGRGPKRDEHYSSYQFTSYDNPHLSVETIDRDRLSMPEEIWRCEGMAEFLDDVNFVFPWKILSTAQDESVEIALNRSIGHVYSMGVDVAKTNDFTVISVLDCTNPAAVKLAYIERFNASSMSFASERHYWDYVVERIKTIGKIFEPYRVMIDASSAGNPVLEAVQSELPQAEGYTFSNSLQNPKKVQLIQQLKLGFEQKRLKLPVNCDYLYDELRFYEYKISESNNLLMNAQSGKHDDCVISLALAWTVIAAPVGPTTVSGVKAGELVPNEPVFNNSTQGPLLERLDWPQGYDFGNPSQKGGYSDAYIF